MKACLAFLIRLITGVYLSAELNLSDRPRLYFANHSSHLDFVVIWSVLTARERERARPVAAAEYWERGPLRRWIAQSWFRSILIPRRPKEMRNANPIDLMNEAISAGSDLIFFPEGTRSRTGRIASFKSGLFHLAKKHPEIDLIPVYLENLNRILPKGETIPVPLMGRILFGRPMAGPEKDESRDQFLHRAQSAIVALSSGNLSPSAHEGS